ncbi:hypothetical protein JZ751_016578 [Albula glossodonta]|uniref:Uncharacterized protein n=1 Tax=Albula glossodonta TaxID=121402 RepID=A0A8T2MWE9_9TELE|nr:hypothetical protein JZ751_016578 [Albula glossodonta]
MALSCVVNGILSLQSDSFSGNNVKATFKISNASSSLYRRSPGRVGDRRDSSGLPQDAVGFNPRGPADPGRWDEWGRATHRPEFSEKHVHGSWKRTQSPSQWCDVSSFSPGVPTPSEFRDHRGGLQPEPQLGYAERRRLSPKKRFHTPSGGDSFRSRSREDFQRFQEDRAPPSPLRFSHRDTHPSRHESSLSQRAPTHEWHRAQHSGGSEPVPDRASWSSSRDSPRPKRGRSAWGEEYEVPGSVSNTEASHCSVQYHGRSPYSESVLKGLADCAIVIVTMLWLYAQQTACVKLTADVLNVLTCFTYRCAEEPRVRHSSERRLDVRDVPSGRRRSTERAPLIVEHDHGHVNCGTSREANGERRASTCDRMHTREGPSDRYHRVGSQPYRDKTSFDRDVGSQGQPLHKRSPALSGDRCGTAPKMFPRPPRSQQFQEQLGQDSNGDVDLRRMEPVEPREMGVPHRPPIGGEQGGKVKQKKVFQKGGFRFPAAVRATPQETLTIKVDMQRPVAQNRYGISGSSVQGTGGKFMLLCSFHSQPNSCITGS